MHPPALAVPASARTTRFKLTADRSLRSQTVILEIGQRVFAYGNAQRSEADERKGGVHSGGASIGALTGAARDGRGHLLLEVSACARTCDSQHHEEPSHGRGF